MSIKTFWENSVVNKLLIIFPLFWIILAIIFGIYDLSISKFLFDPGSKVGNFVENFGEIPGILFGLFVIFTLGGNVKFKKIYYKKVFFLGEVLVSTFLFIYLVKIFFDDFNFEFTSIYGVTLVLIFILLSLIFFYLFKTKFSKFQKRNHNFAKLSVYLFIICGFIVEIIKILWGRIRFRDLQEGLNVFTAWYLPRGITGENSFPSGHAYLGWILIPLIILFMNKSKIKKWIVISLTVFLGLFISFERIVIGAHYASDVLFSAGIVITTFLILYKIYFSRKNNLIDGKEEKT